MSQTQTEDFELTLTATLYYLYQQAGSPNGNTFEGFNTWLATAVTEPFQAAAGQWALEEPLTEG